MKLIKIQNVSQWREGANDLLFIFDTGTKERICCVYLNKYEYEVQPNLSLNCTNTARLSTFLILLLRH